MVGFVYYPSLSKRLKKSLKLFGSQEVLFDNSFINNLQYVVTDSEVNS